jgi:SAM-dependent methyltransferase
MSAGVFQKIADFPLYVRRVILAAPFMNSAILPTMPRSMRWALRRTYFLPYDVADRLFAQRDDLVPPRSWIYDGGVEDFKRTGEFVVRNQLVQLGGLTPNHRVLDVGCGIGRQAVALTEFLSGAGSYDGVDIVPRGIGWSRDHVSSRYHNFRFHLADVYNKEYNPKGKLRARDYAFPFSDTSFDFVFLTSVFTHMLPDDVEHYIAEISRLLKPGGRCLATFFLLNRESRRLMAAAQSVIAYKHDCGVYRTVSARVPELSVAYDEAFIVELLGKHGLELTRPIYHGGWDGRNGSPHLGQQDIVVSCKAAS